ncbi:MAG: hypothetical protein ACD_75C00027G0003, partial [uncultured bacterium]
MKCTFQRNLADGSLVLHYTILNKNGIF